MSDTARAPDSENVICVASSSFGSRGTEQRGGLTVASVCSNLLYDGESGRARPQLHHRAATAEQHSALRARGTAGARRGGGALAREVTASLETLPAGSF